MEVLMLFGTLIVPIGLLIMAYRYNCSWDGLLELKEAEIMGQIRHEDWKQEQKEKEDKQWFEIKRTIEGKRSFTLSIADVNMFESVGIYDKLEMVKIRFEAIDLGLSREEVQFAIVLGISFEEFASSKAKVSIDACASSGV